MPLLNDKIKKDCGLPIELGHDAVTYCYLIEGHEGRCRPTPPLCELCRLTSEWYKKNYPYNDEVFYRPKGKVNVK